MKMGAHWWAVVCSHMPQTKGKGKRGLCASAIARDAPGQSGSHSPTPWAVLVLVRLLLLHDTLLRGVKGPENVPGTRTIERLVRAALTSVSMIAIRDGNDTGVVVGINKTEIQTASSRSAQEAEAEAEVEVKVKNEEIVEKSKSAFSKFDSLIDADAR